MPPPANGRWSTEQILADLHDGNSRDVLDGLIALHGQAVRRFLAWHPHAEDIWQDVFFHLPEIIRGCGDGSLRAYCIGVARNFRLRVDAGRAKATRAQASLDPSIEAHDLASTVLDPQQAAIEEENRRDARRMFEELRRKVARLPAQTRDILTMRGEHVGFSEDVRGRVVAELERGQLSDAGQILIEAALQCLSPNELDVLCMNIFAQVSMYDVAAVLGVDLQKSMQIRRSALDRLHEALRTMELSKPIEYAVIAAFYGRSAAAIKMTRQRALRRLRVART